MAAVEREGLDELHLTAREREQLESMGFTTLGQVAQSHRDDLGLGKEKGEQIGTRAQQILVMKHVERVSSGEGQVEIDVDAVSPGVIAAVKGFVNAYDDPSYGNCAVTVVSKTILLRQLQSRPALEFANIVAKAQKMAERIERKRQRDLVEQGITLPAEQVRAFARERGFTGFWQAVFEEIEGQDVMKQALAAGAFSPPTEPIHVLVIGEPASAKTLAREILLQNFGGLTPVGGNTTRAGLVCDLRTGELGALAFSDGKTVLVDEFDKIDSRDLSYCLELLSNGRCDVHSAKVHETIQSRFTMLAFANPEGDIFSGDLRSDIGLRPTVMSRFALLVKVGSIHGVERLNLFRRSLTGKGELKRLPEYYDQWLTLARLYDPAWKISEDAGDRYVLGIDTIVERYMATPLRRDIRMRDYLRRLPVAMARAEFSPVEDRHLEQALELFEASLETWQ